MSKNICDVCGADRGTEGVVTVLLEKRADGSIEHLYVRECQECARKAAREGGQE